jgi:hypothetical protein
MEKIIMTLANNLKDNINLKDKEVSGFMCKILKGIIHQSTIRKYIPSQFKSPYGITFKCPICNKKKIKDLARHYKRTHNKVLETRKERILVKA